MSFQRLAFCLWVIFLVTRLYILDLDTRAEATEALKADARGIDHCNSISIQVNYCVLSRPEGHL